MTTKTTKSDDSEALAKLAALVEASKSARLTKEQETESIALVQALLPGAKAKIAAAADAMINLPWIVAVDATVAAWPDLKPTGKKNFLAALAEQQTEQGRRVRLSLGRALLPLDADTALKLIQQVCAEMVTGENNEPTQKDRQAFANVLIGKGKPWLLHLPLAEFKDPAPVMRCALLTCCSQQCPPLTQLSVVRWIAGAGELAKLPQDLLDLIASSVKRWHGKLQTELKKDIPELPPVIEESLKAQPPQPASQPAQQPRQERQQREPRQEQAPRPDRADREPRHAPDQSEAADSPARENRDNRDSRDSRDHRDHDDSRQGKRQQQSGGRQGNFDLGATLRQIESHVQSLRAELNQAKAQAQSGSREGGRGRGRDRRGRDAEPAVAADPAEIDELKRHNVQLADTITELRAQLEDLAADHEDIATSMNAHAETPLPEGKEQLLALLGIKLQEAYADFIKLGKEPPDEVFCKHYQFLLDHVFEELEKQGVKLK